MPTKSKAITIDQVRTATNGARGVTASFSNAGSNDMNTSNEHMQQAAHGLMKACEDMNVMAREHMDAAMKSTTAMMQGCEELGRNINGLIQESMSKAATASKTLMSAKNPRELMDMHSEFVKECFDSWMASTGKISEISARTTKESVEPMANHASNTMSKLMQKAGKAA